MKQFLSSLAAVVVLGATLSAQSATPGSKLVWDQTAPDLASANAYTYRLFADGSSSGTTITGVSCVLATGTAYTCQAPFPAFVPGSHNIVITTASAAGESAKSAPFGFVFVVVPSAPANVRIG